MALGWTRAALFREKSGWEWVQLGRDSRGVARSEIVRGVWRMFGVYGVVGNK